MASATAPAKEASSCSALRRRPCAMPPAYPHVCSGIHLNRGLPADRGDPRGSFSGVKTVGGCVVALCLLVAAATAPAKEGSMYRPATRSAGGIVTSESPVASQVGRAVLDRGGNAIDAAVSMVFALNVARPQS